MVARGTWWCTVHGGIVTQPDARSVGDAQRLAIEMWTGLDDCAVQCGHRRDHLETPRTPRNIWRREDTITLLAFVATFGLLLLFILLSLREIAKVDVIIRRQGPDTVRSERDDRE